MGDGDRFRPITRGKKRIRRSIANGQDKTRPEIGTGKIEMEIGEVGRFGRVHD